LAGALPVTLGLIRIYLAHFFEQILRVRARNIGRARPTAVTLFRPPWHRFDRFLNPLWHREKGTGNRANRNPSGDFLFVPPCPNRVRACLPAFAPDVRISGMKFFVAWAVLLLVVAGALAQSPQGSPSPGEMAVLENKPRSATAIARRATEVYFFA